MMSRDAGRWGEPSPGWGRGRAHWWGRRAPDGFAVPGAGGVAGSRSPGGRQLALGRVGSGWVRGSSLVRSWGAARGDTKLASDSAQRDEAEEVSCPRVNTSHVCPAVTVPHLWARLSAGFISRRCALASFPAPEMGPRIPRSPRDWQWCHHPEGLGSAQAGAGTLLLTEDLCSLQWGLGCSRPSSSV